MQFSEIITQVYRRLHESETSPKFWTLTQVKAAINEGYEEMCEASECYETNDSISLRELVSHYNLAVLCTYPVLTVTGIWNAQTNRWLSPITVRDLDNSFDKRWSIVTGEPERWFMRSPTVLGVFPKAPATSGTLTVYYRGIPVAMSADADLPCFPKEFHYGLVNYGLYDLQAQDGEVEFSLEQWAEYLQVESGLRNYKGNRTLDRVGRFQ